MFSKMFASVLLRIHVLHSRICYKKKFIILCVIIVVTLTGKTFIYQSWSRTSNIQSYDVFQTADTLKPQKKSTIGNINQRDTSEPEASNGDISKKDEVSRAMSHMFETEFDDTLHLEYLVNSSACKIPKFNPWDLSMKHALQRLEPLDCGQPLAYAIGDRLYLNESSLGHYGIKERRHVSCCYSNFIFQKPNVNATISKICTTFETETQIKTEFIRVQCRAHNRTIIYTDFFYTVPLKPEVEKRCSKIISESERNESNFSTTDDESENQVPVRYSVMILGLDATSRLNVERYLPRTREYILNVLKGVEMLGYNKVGDNTFPNLVPLLTGLTEEELQMECLQGEDYQYVNVDDCDWIWKLFASVGYRTIYGEDQPWIDTFHFCKKGFVEPPTDYFLRPLMLQTRFTIANRHEGCVDLCLGKRPQYQVTASWAFNLMERLRNLPYFGLVWSNSLTHDKVNNLQHADSYFYDALRGLYENGHLNNTFLLFLSDHGIRWGKLRVTSIGRFEERLPALYIIAPPGFRETHPNEFSQLLRNSRKLTTPFDLYVTLNDIAKLATSTHSKTRWSTTEFEGEVQPSINQRRGVSMFTKMPENRTCQQAGIDSQWCACDKSVSVAVTDPMVQLVAIWLVNAINNKTEEARNQCDVFVLERPLSALREITPETSEANYYYEEEEEEVPMTWTWHVVALVLPGNAIFEGTVLSNANGTGQQLDGPISRLSQYGNQSACVDDRNLKMFCYCSNYI